MAETWRLGFRGAIAIDSGRSVTTSWSQRPDGPDLSMWCVRTAVLAPGAERRIDEGPCEGGPLAGDERLAADEAGNITLA